MKDNGHDEAIEILTNLNTSHSILKVKPNYKVWFNDKCTFNKILGFKEGLYCVSHDHKGCVNYVSQKAINITGK